MMLVRILSPILVCLVSLFPSVAQSVSKKGERLILLVEKNAPSRVSFGVDHLAKTLRTHGYQVAIQTADEKQKVSSKIIWVGTQPKSAGTGATPILPGKEGFRINISKHSASTIAGSDASGLLYGCLELADRVKLAGGLPTELDFTDSPEMVLRGTCIGLQKPYYLPGRTVYEYPYTEETFPWFYDKQLWLRTLDSLVVSRYNSLYLWNGHPFASLVKVKDYPYAVEVDDATFKRNEEMYRFITEEADKRGIWVIQMFYNIIVSKPFAEKHGIKTQERERPILPYVADYTRKSIAAFVEKYPNVGLLVTLGEAMEGVGHDDVEWFTKTIIPGVQDGLKALGSHTEPPIVLRAHDTDAPMVMAEAKKIYANLYTMAKYNGEALTTYTPRGPWAELHRKLSSIGTVHIENVHILANLEPFRYASADFIQRSVQAMHNVYGANGLHLYPQASYWDWPYAADSATSKLLQIDRDWLWYRQWARYAWNSRHQRKDEIKYWSSLMAANFKTDTSSARHILKAYEEAGEISPKLLRRFGITDGNRQTLTLGMTMPQLVNPNRFGLFTLLYNSEGPEGEMLSEYAERAWKGEKHVGETPVQIIDEVKKHGDAAVEAIDKAAAGVSSSDAEFKRIRNDMYIHRAMAYHYAEKAAAALDALRYKYSNDLEDLRKASTHLKESVRWYRELTKLTNPSYRYANSMQTQQRKIPYRGVNATFKQWWEVLPEFEKELAVFNKRIDSLQQVPKGTMAAAKPLLVNEPVSVSAGKAGSYQPIAGSQPFAGQAKKITAAAAELANLQGMATNAALQTETGTTLTFTTQKPVTLLVGFFNSKTAPYLPAPELETNASANDYGQADIKIANALLIDSMPPVNVHAYSFKPGTHTLTLSKGICLLLGFVPGNTPLAPYDAALHLQGKKQEVDWMFE